MGVGHAAVEDMGVALVTGATGLIGASLTRALAQRGERVVALTRADAPGAPGVERVVGEIADQALLTRAVAEHGVDTVFHLAARATADADPAAIYATNLAGLTAVLEAARLGGARRFVVAGSIAGAGAPTDAYTISKAAQEVIARSYWPVFGLPVAVARLTNVYGAGDRNASRLVPELIAAVRDGRAPDIRSDGTPRHDFLYVEDAAAALIALAAALDDDASGARGAALAVGHGTSHSVRDVVSALERAAGRPLHARYGPPAPGGPPPGDRAVDIAPFTRATGWAPATSLDDGLRRTLASAAPAEAQAPA